MQIHGIVRTAVLTENPPGSEVIELVLKVQGVGAGQPRTIVVPYELLLEHPEIDADQVSGHGFRAEVEEESPGRWVAIAVGFADGRVLRRPEGEE